MGTPFIRAEGSHFRVDFFWRDPYGSEAESETVQVLLEVNSVTDHHSWEPKALTRLQGTDVWHGYVNITSGWIGSYAFIPLTKSQTPAVARKNSDGSMQAQRQWYMSVINQAQADPLNLTPGIISGRGVSCSALHMPNAEKSAVWQDWDEHTLPAVEKASMSFSWHSDVLNNDRQIVCFSTAEKSNQKQSLVILLDGQRWSYDSGLPSVIGRLTEQGELAGATYLLISSIDTDIRWQELSCHAPFWSAVFTELIPHLKDHFKLNLNEQNITIAGQSLGGLSALYAGLKWPGLVKNVVSLSGSFWWPNFQHMGLSVSERKKIIPGSLTEQIAHGTLKADHLNVFMSVGSYEKQLVDYNELMSAALAKAGCKLTYETYCGGHDWLAWRYSLVRGLKTVLKPKDAPMF